MYSEMTESQNDDASKKMSNFSSLSKQINNFDAPLQMVGQPLGIKNQNYNPK